MPSCLLTVLVFSHADFGNQCHASSILQTATNRPNNATELALGGNYGVVSETTAGTVCLANKATSRDLAALSRWLECRLHGICEQIKTNEDTENDTAYELYSHRPLLCLALRVVWHPRRDPLDRSDDYLREPPRFRPHAS